MRESGLDSIKMSEMPSALHSRGTPAWRALPPPRLSRAMASSGLQLAICALLLGALGQVGAQHEPPQLLAPPHQWIRELNALDAAMPRGSRIAIRAVNATLAYLNLLAGVLTSASLECDLTQPEPDALACLKPLRFGYSWPRHGVSMVGLKRMMNIKNLLIDAHETGVRGSYLEAGVWRGGMSIFAAAVVEAFRLERRVYLCDSFEGLPPPRAGSLRGDEKFYFGAKRYLAQGEAHVARNFRM